VWPCDLRQLIRGGITGKPRYRGSLVPDSAPLIWALLLAAATAGLVVAIRQRDQRQRDRWRLVYRLASPRGMTGDQVVAFVRARAVLMWQWVVYPAVVRTHSSTTQRSSMPGPDRARLAAKLAEPVFAAIGRVGAATATRRRSEQLAAVLHGAVHQLARPGVRF